MTLTIAGVPPLQAAAVAAPTTAPGTFQQLTNTAIAHQFAVSGGPVGGIGGGGAFSYMWRARFVTRYGVGPAGPATALQAINGTTHMVRLKAVPVSADPNVIGVLLERNTQADPSGFHPIILATDPMPYTLVNGATQFDDSMPDSTLGATIAISGTSGMAQLSIAPASLASSHASRTGDAAVQSIPENAYMWITLQVSNGDGTTQLVDVPAFRRGY